MAKHISPTFDDEQVEIIDQIKGLGKNLTEKVKNIVISWLSEHKHFNK